MCKNNRYLFFFVLIISLSLSSFSTGTPKLKNKIGIDEKEWVVYSTDIGWLRIGPYSEYKAVWLKKDEIWGGTSTDTLDKTLLLQGFSSWEEAAEILCSKLTKVQLHISPPARGAPTRYITAMYDTSEYYLRLTKGFSEDAVIAMSKGNYFKGLEYNWKAEWESLRSFNITPRYIFPSKQWLIHATGRSTYQGPQEIDMWMCFTRAPDENGNFTIPLADGTTQGHNSDKHEGPFLDSYTFATVMKKNGLKSIDLWPPVTSYTGRDVQPRVNAEEIPDNPKDYGNDVLPQQPILPDTTLEDWVIYEIEGGWLHVGTRYEFETPIMKREVIWGGNSEEAAKKTLLAPPKKERYYSRQQAMIKLCSELTAVTAEYHPLAEPKETINAKYKGKDYRLRIDRGANGGSVLEYKSLHYDYWNIWSTLAENKITPRRKFSPAKLVHVIGYYTYSGPQKADRWQLVPASAVRPDGKSMVLADGMGGTMGYTIDYGSDELKSNYDLSPLLKSLISGDEKLKSKIGSMGTRSLYHGIRPDEVPPNARDHGGPLEFSKIKIDSVKPNEAPKGSRLGVRLLATGIDRGCDINLGEDIEVYNLVYGGRDADSDFDQWYCTVDISDFAETGKRDIFATNADGGKGTLSEAFEVTERTIELCPPLRLILPAQTPATVPGPIRTLVKSKPIELRFEIEKQVNEQKSKLHILKDIVDELLQVEGSIDPGSFRKRDLLLDNRIKVEEEIRKIENKYASFLARCATKISDDEYAKIINSLEKRIKCISDRRKLAIDKVRHQPSVFDFKDYLKQKYSIEDYIAKKMDFYTKAMIKELEYESYCDNTMHSLKWWQHLNSLRLLKVKDQILQKRLELIRTTGKIDSKELKPLQRKLRDIYIDQGRVAVRFSQANIEETLYRQDSYWAAWNQVKTQAGNTEAMKKPGDRGWQNLIFGTKYMVAGFGAAFNASVDKVKQGLNIFLTRFTSLEMTTVSGGITQRFKETREKTELALNTLNRIKGYNDKQTVDLKTRDISKDVGLKYLMNDRIFIEQTSGGISRLAACYNTDILELMDDEFEIAIEHAEQSAKDMRTVLNLALGANPEGITDHLKRLVVNPVGFVSTRFQYIKGHFTATEDWVAKREAQIKELEGMRTKYQKYNYETEPDSIFAKRDSINFQLHDELRRWHPDYVQYLITLHQLNSQRRLEFIEGQLRDTFEPDKVKQLKAMQERNKRLLAYKGSKSLGKLFFLQGMDRMVVWDYDGALECFYQAYEIDGSLLSFETLEQLRQDFAWNKTVEAGTEVITNIGNLGVHTAMFAAVGNTMGEFLGVGPMPFEGNFADFVWMQVNPFSSLTKSLAVEQTWQNVLNASAQTGVMIGQAIVTQEVLAKSFMWLGIDNEWADFFANSMTSVAMHTSKSGETIIGRAFRQLRDAANRMAPKSVNIELWNNRQRARKSIFDEFGLLKAMRELDENQKQLKNEKPASKAYRIIRQKIGRFTVLLLNKLTPLTEARLEVIFDNFQKKLNKAKSPDERMKLIKEFLIENPLHRITPLMKGRDPNGFALGKKIDNLRLELVSNMQERFLVENPQFAQHFEAYVHNGTWANRDWPGYKYLGSDMDINMLVKRDTPAKTKTEMKNAFDKFFFDKTEMPPEALKVTVFVDSEPVFRVNGESYSDFMQNINNSKMRAKLQKEMGENLDALRRNLGEGERYLLKGTIFYLQFMNKFAEVKKFRNGKLVNDPDGARIYDNMKFAPWMGFDMVIGQLALINKARSDYPRDNIGYMKTMDKYALRAMLGVIVQSPRGLHELHRMNRDFVKNAGGIEQSIVKLIEKIGKQPDEMKPPSTALSAEAALKRGLRELGMSPEHAVLLREWIANKEGRPVNEVFKTRAGNRVLRGNDPQLNNHAANHINKTEGFIRDMVRKTIIVQATFLKKLGNDMKVEQNPEKYNTMKSKMLEILYSQASRWNELSNEQRLWILKESPPQAEFWLVIAELDRIRNFAGQSNWRSVLTGFVPMVFIKEDAELQRRADELRRQAAALKESDFLNSQIQ